VADDPCLGDLGIAHQERALRMARGMEMLHSGALGTDVAAHMKESDRLPRGEGGALAYLIETPAGSILWKDSSGHWSGILHDLRPDVALLAAVGRGNVDGEPVQGTLADFIASEVELLRPKSVVLCHHDDWMPPLTKPIDVAPIRRELASRAPGARLVEMGYLEGRRFLD
jgi:L-ascorbate metabolism protein UlaG (beta-lactamase superfamily)